MKICGDVADKPKQLRCKDLQLGQVFRFQSDIDGGYISGNYLALCIGNSADINKKMHVWLESGILYGVSNPERKVVLVNGCFKVEA